MAGFYVLIVILISFSAFFSGSETALFTLSRVQIKMLGERGGRTGAAIAKLLSNPRRVLNTLLLCNLLVNTILSATLSEVFLKIFGPGGLGIAVVISTILLLLFGEITPKVVGLAHYIGFAKIAVYPVSFFCILFAPLRFLVRIASNGVLRLCGMPLEKSDRLTRDTYYAALLSGKRDGSLGPNEADVIHSICTYRTMTAAELRQPRTEMPSIDEQSTLEEAITKAENEFLIFLPVFRRSIDQIVGILELPKISLDWRNLDKNKTLCQYMREKAPFISSPFLVPGTSRLEDLLKEMRRNDIPGAVVLDEYGGTDGWLLRHQAVDTMLGGLIGFKKDEIKIFPEGDIIAPASTNLVELNWECSLDFPTEPDATLGAFIMRRLGKIPNPGEFLVSNGFKLIVLRKEGLKLETILLKPERGEEKK